jgi:hypothetical protein
MLIGEGRMSRPIPYEQLTGILKTDIDSLESHPVGPVTPDSIRKLQSGL